MTDILVPWSRYERSSRLGGRAVIQDVRLHALDAQIHDFGAEPPLSVNLDVDTEVVRTPGADHFVVAAKYDVSVSRGLPEGDPDQPGGEADLDSDGQDQAATITLQYLGLFGLAEPDGSQLQEFEDDELDAFAETVGLTTLHPYARELIQDVTTRLGLPSLTIGMVRISRYPEG